MQFWIEYGQVAESAGRPLVAREAYGEASRLSPKNPQILEAIRNVEERMTRLRGGTSPSVPAP